MHNHHLPKSLLRVSHGHRNRRRRPRFCQVNLLLARKGNLTLPQNNLSKRKAYVGPRKDIPRRLRYNAVSPDWQRQACQQLGLRFVSDNGSAPGGPNVPLAYPACGKKIQGDGNCLFQALYYTVTGAEGQHFRLRSVIVEHMRSLAQSVHGLYLEGNLMMQESLEEYLVQSDMQCNGVWGTDVEVVVAAHLLDVNLAIFNVPAGDYVGQSCPAHG